MKFFVPYSNQSDGEALWAEVRDTLREIGMPTTERRIQALSLGHDARERILAVGMSFREADDPILLILEASDSGIFYACTPSNGVHEGVPYPLALCRHGSAIDFDPPRPQRLH